MRLALALPLAFSSLLLGDPDAQPACRAQCEEAYGAEAAACRQQSRQPVDECIDEARDRHQECIDRCND